MAEPLMDATVALRHWRPEEAREALERLQGVERPIAVNGSSSDAQFLLAQVLLLEGEYDAAIRAMSLIPKTSSVAQMREVPALMEQMEGSRVIRSRMVRHESGSGAFVVWVTPGPDEVLISRAFETLERALPLLADRIGVKPVAPIRIEIIPSAALLAKVSTLTQAEVEGSGTIALCAWNRVLLVTPRAVAGGFPWLDTLVHELVHYLVTLKTGDKVPVWLHEGLAKVLERVWRQDVGQGGEAKREEEAFLLRKAMEGSLIPLEGMEPALARLPSVEEAGLAFAEVESLMAFLLRKALKGSEPIRLILEAIESGVDAKTAVGAVAGVPFEQLVREWKAFLVGLAKERQEEQAKEQKEVGVGGETLRDAEDYLKLAKLLRSAKRLNAALVELRKGRLVAGESNGVLNLEMGQVLNELAGIEKSYATEAALVLEGEVRRNPNGAAAYVELALSYRLLGRFGGAAEALVRGERLDPFAPGLYEGQVESYRMLNQPEEQRRAEGNLSRLRGLKRGGNQGTY